MSAHTTHFDDCGCQSARLTKERDEARSLARELVEALETMAEQYGCTCGHPACKRCRDTKEAQATIAKAKEALK